MGFDGLNGLTDRGRCVLEAFQPLVEVDATLADGVKRFIRHTTGNHLMMEVVVTHVAGSAMRVCHHHDFLYTQLVDGYYQASILDGFGRPVLEETQHLLLAVALTFFQET